jgi:hypothetical protein
MRSFEILRFGLCFGEHLWALGPSARCSIGGGWIPILLESYASFASFDAYAVDMHHLAAKPA